MKIRKGRIRVATQAEACEYLGLSRPRLQEFKGTDKTPPAKWWQDWFWVEGEGYDVCAIAAAQYFAEGQRNGGTVSTTTTTAVSKRIEAAELQTAEETARIKSLDRKRKERHDFADNRAVVGSDVVVRSMWEAFIGLRDSIDDLAFDFSRYVPAEMKHLVFNPDFDPADENCDAEPAVLQELIEDLVMGYGQLLDMAGTEVFTDEAGDDLIEGLA